MRRVVWSFVPLIAVVPACTSTGPADIGPEFAPPSAYRLHRDLPPPEQIARVSPPRAFVPPMEPRRPDRSLTGTPYVDTWYPHSKPISDRWTTIVIHHSGTMTGSARTFDKYHREKRGWDSLGYHFVIGNGSETPDGLVEVGPRWEKQKHGAHCKTPSNYYNDHGIGICLVGDFTKTRPTRRQLESLDRLVAFLCRVCHIPPSRIVTHGDINRKTLCPGKNFALGPVRAYVNRVVGNPGRSGNAAVAGRRQPSRYGRYGRRSRIVAPEQLNRDRIRAEGYNTAPITRRTVVR